MKKYRIKGKIYRFIKDLFIEDTSLVKSMCLVENSKGAEFTLVRTYKYTLYDSNKKQVLSTYSITELGVK